MSTASRQDPLLARRHREVTPSQHRDDLRRDDVSEVSEYRVDLERLRFSPYFARLAAVTQVIPQSGVGPVLHNRLTHSLKVSAVARVIAAELAGTQAAYRSGHHGGARDRDGDAGKHNHAGRILTQLGGVDTIVAQAAAHAHDLGHPPFGHLGEQVLDRVARTRFGLSEGFEGNAQTFRVLTTLDTLGRPFSGLNLTAAVRASVLKYPWSRGEWTHERIAGLPRHERPRGVGDATHGAEKFSFYQLEAEEAHAALAAHPHIAEGHQTLACAVMDIADDIAYAVHDLDDFTRAGVLQFAPVSAELEGWLRDPHRDFAPREPGAALQELWRSLAEKDQWIADHEVFHEAVRRVRDELVDGLLSRPYDGSMAAERAVSTFTRGWIEHLRASVDVHEHPATRSGHISLKPQAWHEVAVLKFVHAHFVLQGTQLGAEQRGTARVLEELVIAFDTWVSDPHDARRAPIRLREDIEQVTEHTAALAAPGTSLQKIRRAGQGRAVIDYVASLTDQQALVTHAQLTRGAVNGWLA